MFLLGEDAKTGSKRPALVHADGIDACSIGWWRGLQVPALSLVLACFLVAPEEAAHWKWHCDDSFPRAWGTTVQPENHPLSLSARVCRCPGSQPLHRECLLQVGLAPQGLRGGRWWLSTRPPSPSSAFFWRTVGSLLLSCFISALCVQLAEFTWCCNWWCWHPGLVG